MFLDDQIYFFSRKFAAIAKRNQMASQTLLPLKLKPKLVSTMARTIGKRIN